MKSLYTLIKGSLGISHQSYVVSFSFRVSISVRLL